MRRVLSAVSATIALTAAITTAYEWKTHNGLSSAGRHYLLSHYPFDNDFRGLLRDLQDDGLGDKYIDSRAGNPCDPEKVLCPGVDEDHAEGYELKALSCLYVEGKCASSPPWAPWPVPGLLNVMACTKDHFLHPLSVPLPATDAVSHTTWYFDVAVRNYKASLCNTRMKDFYRKSAAQALGHVLHLVGDMGSPQHAGVENHGPFPLGNGPSFLEYWSLDVWDQQQTYVRPDNGLEVPVGNLVVWANQAAEPKGGRFDQIMSDLAEYSEGFVGGSPYHLESRIHYSDLERILVSSGLQPIWEITTEPRTFRLTSFLARQFPPYYRHLEGDSGKYDDRHKFGDPWFSYPDFWSTSAEFRDDVELLLTSREIATRLWAEPDLEHPEYPIVFDNELKELIGETTNATAGVILSFWEHVRGFQCPCEDITPCDVTGVPTDSASHHSSTPLAPSDRCDPPPAPPYTPGRDFPDDNAGVLAAAPAAPLFSGDVSDTDSAWSLNHWERVAALGIEKNVTSLSDYGRAMWLAIQGAEPAAPQDELEEESATAIAHEIGELSTKYRTERRRPEDDIPTVARVAVLEAGFHGGAAALLDRLGHLYVTIGHEFDPLAAAEAHPLLLVPSGGLYGAASSAALRERFAAPLPLPPGVGWCEGAARRSGAAHVATTSTELDTIPGRS